MKMIILAAGRGSRLQALTDSIPKCMVKINGQSLLKRQLKTARACGIKDIIVIKGYQSEKIKYKNIKYYINKNFAKTNMVYTLFCAKKELNEPVIISYGDILYSEQVLKALIADAADMSVVVDTEWKKYWAKRADNPFDDAESLILNDKSEILEIGRKPATKENTHAQYIGLTKFSKKGINALVKTYRAMKMAKNIYFTDLLQKLIKEGPALKAVLIKRNWFEIDTAKDIAIAEKEMNF